MKEPKRRRSLSGAVLVMILTVMFVLIILLAATLTTVTTANQRIYTKFEENQAYYTARSALDVFTLNMLGDDKYWSGKTYDYTDKNVSPAQIKTGQKMKQGLALQHDLYSIHSQCETYGKDGSGKAILQWAENMESTDAANIFSPVNMDVAGTPPEQNYFSISSTALNTEPVSTNKQYDYIEYQVTLPVLDDGSNNYGRFVDNDQTTSNQIAKIKVEVLDRVYATDPGYTSDQLKRYFTHDADQTGCPANDADLMAAIAKGSRNKDYMRIKITSTVTVMGTEGMAVVIIETTEKDTPANDQALTATGKFSGAGGAQSRLMGGGATMDLGIAGVGDGNNMFGSIYSLGQLKWVSSTDTSINKNEFIVAMGGIAPSSNPTKIKARGSGSYVFLGGTSTLDNGGDFGDSTNKLPVFADKIVKKSATDLNFHGDVYATTFEVQDSNPNKVVVSDGNLYTNNLIIPDDWFVDVNGDGSRYEINLSNLSAANLQLCSGYTISSASGTHNVHASDLVPGATLYAISGGGTVPTASDSGFDINSFTIQERDGKLYRRYENLPFSVGGHNYIDVPTAQSYFGEYFKEDAFHEETGELKDYYNQTNYNLTDPINAYSNIYSNANKNLWLLTGADMLAEYLELPALASGAAPRTISGMLSDGTIAAKVPVENMPTGTVDIDLSGGDKCYVLSGNYSGCKWTVKGTGGRLILLMEEDSNTHLMDASGNMDWSSLSYTVTFDNCELITEYIDTTAAKTDIINGTTKAPRIDIYGGTGSFLNTGNQNFICGYFMMPTGYVYLNNGKTSGKYTNGGVKIDPVSNLAVVGSILCNEFCESNQSAVLFLDKNSGGTTPGEPILNTNSSTYIRS